MEKVLLEAVRNKDERWASYHILLDMQILANIGSATFHFRVLKKT